jgi:hypothetical protein
MVVWRVHNKELYNLYTLPVVIRAIKSSRINLVKHVAYMEEMGNLEGKGPLWKPSYKWKNNIKRDPKLIGWEGVD